MLETLGINWRRQKGGRVAVFGGKDEELGVASTEFPCSPLSAPFDDPRLVHVHFNTAQTPTQTRVMGELLTAPALSSSVSTLSEDVYFDIFLHNPG